MVLFWFYFSGLPNRNVRKKYLDTGDWSLSLSGALALLCSISVTLPVYPRICFGGSHRQADYWVDWLQSKKLICLGKYITKTRLFKYTETFITQKIENFQIKNSDIVLVSAQNIDCGYSLKPPR